MLHYPNHKGIPDTRMDEIMEEFIRGLQRRPDQEAYIKIEGAEWNEGWRKKWGTYCNIERSCFKLVWEEGGLSNEDKNKIPPRLSLIPGALQKAAVEESMAFFIVLEAVLERKYWWLPERYVTCAVKDLPTAIQQFLLEMYIMHNGWGIYYFKDAGCVMVEVDNYRLNDVLGREEEEGGGQGR
jgi:hypothetical protein